MFSTKPPTDNNAALDPTVCREARLSRDSRFDGEFFLGVVTTGIYCRPICPARAPAEKNVRYFRNSASASAEGFRPCLRCRPESAPNSPAWKGTTTTVQRALQLIESGALNSSSVADLAARLGVGERYLRKLFLREIGTSPQAIAQNQRLLFARKLLLETSLPMTDVAYASGFSSLRRFNSAVRESLRDTPTNLRQRGHDQGRGGSLSLLLQYRPPYDWEGVINFFQRHSLEGLEQASDSEYRRNVEFGGSVGSFSLAPHPSRSAMVLTVDLADQSRLMPLVARVRRMFDLDANPGAIAQQLAHDETLAALIERYPGIRAPVHFSPFESAVRSIVGQQVSVAGARTVSAKIIRSAFTDDKSNHGFPTAEQLGLLPDDCFAMPGRRRDTLRRLFALAQGCEDSLTVDQLSELKGVGPWTCQLFAMRGLGDIDIFPTGDLGLVRAWQRDNDESSAELTQRSEQWRPWRTYAANLLWRSLSE